MLMPDANIAVAHGQMTERDLEETMLSFINNEYDRALSFVHEQLQC
jgi:transcription-repair coupling factor (superfamily II helicase)